MLVASVGLIRSGSTLQYNMLRSVLEFSSAEPVKSHGFYSRKRAWMNALQFNAWSRDSQWHLVKMHKVPSFFKYLNPLWLFAVYRDLDAVARSARMKFGYGPNEVVNEVTKSLRSYEQICARGHSLLLFDYSDLVNRPEWSLNAHGETLGFRYSQATITRLLADMNSRMESAAGIVDSATQLHMDHISGRSAIEEAFSDKELDLIRSKLESRLLRLKTHLIQA